MASGSDNQVVVKKWADDGMSVTHTKSTNFSAGKGYVVTIAGSMPIDAKANSYTFEIAEATPTTVVVASVQAMPAGQPAGGYVGREKGARKPGGDR